MACPDDQELLSMLERSMNPARFSELERHIDTCESCRKAVAALAQGSVPTASVPPFAELDHPLAEGAVIGDRYTVARELGRGGMGTVYLAHDRTLGRDVALKLHHASSGADRLQREALAMAKLAHPNVVTVFEVGSIGDRVYVAMEYVRGTTLRAWTDASTPVRARTWRETLAMLVAAGRGLAAAHAAGLVHRDFKPENVLVGDDGRPRVSDFGLARAGAAAIATDPEALTAAPTVSAGVAGTPAYMAPEQMNGELVDARSDQFAFCVAAWEALYGRRPFAGATLGALQASIDAHELAPGNAQVPERVRAVIERGLATDPRARFADMPALLAALERAAAPRTARTAVAVAIGLAVIGGGTAYGAHALATHRHAARCAAAAGAMRARFSPVDHARIAAALTATGSPFAKSSIDHTLPVLDRATDALAAEATGVCRDGALPAHAVAARQACLASRGAELSALVQQLADARAAKDVLGASEAAWRLYAPAPCSEGPVGAPAMQTAFAERLGAIDALEDANRASDALAAGTQLLADARAAHDNAAEVQVALALAELQEQLDPHAAVASYHAALDAAEAQGRDLDAASALAGLAVNLGTDGSEDFTGAHRDIALARAKLARIGGNALLDARLAFVEGQVLYYENKSREAEVAMRRAIDLAQQAFGADDPMVGKGWGTLAEILQGLGRHDEQLAAAQQALASLKRAYGDGHPLVATALGTVGTALADLGRFDEARATLHAADAMFRSIFGPDYPDRASSEAVLGNLEMRTEHWPAARDHLLAARDAFAERMGSASPAVAGMDRDLADVDQMLGDRARGVALDREAVAIYEAEGSDGVQLPAALDDLCDQLASGGQWSEILPLATRALALLEAQPDANPQQLADARLMMARALWETHGDRSQARALATQAEAGSVEPDRKKLAADWLAAHHS